MEITQTDKPKRCRSRQARIAASKAEVARLKAERDREKERLKALEAVDKRMARKGESREKVWGGVAAWVAARADPAVRMAIDVATLDLSERERAHLNREGSLWAQVMAAALTAAQEPFAQAAPERPPLPVISAQASDAAIVVRYARLKLRAMSEVDLHLEIMDMLGAIYVDEVGSWVCADPRFPAIMKSIGRDLDQRIEGLQPEMADRYLTTLRLEKASTSHPSIESWDAFVEWEEIAARDDWVPEPDPTYAFGHSPPSDSAPDATIFGRLQDILDAEQKDGTCHQIEWWNGTWSHDGRVVPVSAVRQSIVLRTWASLVSEAGLRVAQGESARIGRDRFHVKHSVRLKEKEWKGDAKIGWARRRSKYGDNN